MNLDGMQVVVPETFSEGMDREVESWFCCMQLNGGFIRPKPLPLAVDYFETTLLPVHKLPCLGLVPYKQPKWPPVGGIGEVNNRPVNNSGILHGTLTPTHLFFVGLVCTGGIVTCPEWGPGSVARPLSCYILMIIPHATFH